ncbi:Uma2 family endonuclease [Stratiformator vulcanicus]|uniref:Putative restriction endonuclease domain-containing protein n=1 Tax=Stratiformator vulcanicus TaxID=2527980 RepID=A0A517QY93_9PLAN|nr:Uma2 family endonuclease [Stratiformator vulcanicus]QDT36563.1 hypothetical protein Pan189_09230 [Stratiformator vulcanicus]
MSSVHSTDHAASPADAETARRLERVSFPLKSGDHLTQEEFHRRYEETPPGFRAELIGGIVYVSSPVSANHGKPDNTISTWLGVFAARTAGVDAYTNTTVILLHDGEPQPDGCLVVEGGGAELVEQKTRHGRNKLYLKGAPELVVEVAISSADIDSFEKKDDYEKAGVKEYVLVLLEEHEVRWWRNSLDEEQEERSFSEIEPDGVGIYHSIQFPGLWLNSKAFLDGDAAGVLATLEQGLKARND